jgi:polysaccharide chain length determinant protein (PEP-CTERM system associated)
VIQALLRRRWIVISLFAVGVAAAPLLAPLVPERYRSETLILVVPQRVPDSYVKTTVTQTVADRLPTITEQILSRSRLERIIQEMDLYTGERSRMVMEDVVARMRLDINVGMVGNQQDANSFRITYTSDNAEVARRVTERLASSYIEQNITDRENQADSTSQFLGTQLEEAKRRLLDQEKKLEDYKRRNAGQLPTQLQGNLQAIQNANMQLQALSESTNRALERRLLIERQIADLPAIPVPAPPPASVAPEAAVGTGTAQQLAISRARLGSLLQKYTPDHPEVVSLERTVAELVSQLESETPLGAPPAVVERPVSPEEAALKKRALDLQAELAVVDHQLSANKTEDQRLKGVIADYQAKIDAVPARESELVELTRDYSTLQTAYANLLMKREDSMIAANLERRQIGEQFRIIDPPVRPEKPYNQRQRLTVMAAGAGLGLALGLLLVGLLEYRDSSFRREEEVHKALSLPVLALIPLMQSDREQRAARWRTWLLDAGSGALLIAAAAVVVLWRMSA